MIERKKAKREGVLCLPDCKPILVLYCCFAFPVSRAGRV